MEHVAEGDIHEAVILSFVTPMLTFTLLDTCKHHILCHSTFRPQRSGMQFYKSGSTSSSIDRTNLIKIKRPIHERDRNISPSQPSTIATDPNRLSTLPYAMSCTVVAEAMDAVCCQRMEIIVNRVANTAEARATCNTGRDGNG